MWAISAALWLQPGLVLPDGAGYTVYLPSAWISHDLLFFDEWQAMGLIDNGVIQHKDVTSANHLGNHWTVGSALAWFPAFVAADAIRPLTSFPRNGIALPYNVAVVATSAMAGLFTLLIGFAIGREFGGERAAALATIGAWFGTTLLWYSLAHATMSHAVSGMAAALVFAAALRWRRNPGAPAAFLAGLAVGFAFTVRPQNATLGLVPLIVAPITRRLAVGYAAGMAIGVLPQIVVSWFLYDSPIGFLTGGGSATPFAAFQKIWLWEPLFSWYHGLFTWTPFALAGLAGVFVLLKIDRRLAAACLVTFFLQWMINASLERSFWGALSFGQRRFDNCIVIFIIGVAALLRHRSALVRTLLVAAPAAWTFSLFLAARASLISLESYVAPATLAAAQWSALAASASAFVPLGSTPAPFRGVVAILAALFAFLLAIAAVAIRRLPLAAQAAAGASFLAASSLFLFHAGSRDEALIPKYAPLVERNRVYSEIPGGADVRFGLLRDEIDYLRRSGREREARATEHELADLEARRAEALRRRR